MQSKTVLQPGSDEWLSYRSNKIGASDAPIIMGVSPWKSPRKLYEEKLGLSVNETTYPMRRGTAMEEPARKQFMEDNWIIVEPKLMEHPKYEWMIATMDGISEDHSCAVEIKCPGKKDHQTAVDGQIPEKYVPQLQHQMEVCGLDWIFYYSFDGKDGVTLKCHRDQQYIDLLLSMELKFWVCMQTFMPPD